MHTLVHIKYLMHTFLINAHKTPVWLFQVSESTRYRLAVHYVVCLVHFGNN